MSAQINLYHPRFLRQRDLLTLGNVVIAAAAVYALLAAATGWAWQDAVRRTQAAAAVELQLQAAKAQLAAETKLAATRKPSVQLGAELEQAEGLLRRRAEIVRVLESGVIGSTGGFADFLRGFAHQASEGLWLTRFSIDAGGSDIEIRGSMLNPAALPDYIRRLGAEKAFQGRNFAALTMNRADPAPAPRPAGQATGVLPAPTVARPIDFVLTPKRIETKGGAQ